MEGFFDTEYFIEGYVSMKPHWRGLGKSHIYFLPKRKVWRLESFYATEKYADLTADDTDPFAYYPLGRLNWKIYDGICQLEGGNITLHSLLTSHDPCQESPGASPSPPASPTSSPAMTAAVSGSTRGATWWSTVQTSQTRR